MVQRCCRLGGERLPRRIAPAALEARLEVQFPMAAEMPHEMEYSQDKRNAYNSQHDEGFRVPEITTPIGEEGVVANKQ